MRTLCCACVLLTAGFVHAGDDDGPPCEMIGLSSGGSIYQGNCSPHDPNILTVATDMGGSFITRDAGAHWRTIHFRELGGSNSAAAAFHPKDPNTIYWVRGASELRVTHDLGKTWVPTGEAQPWRAEQDDQATIVRIWLDPGYPEKIFVGALFKAARKTFVSEDEGKTWRECEGVNGWLFRVAVERASPADKRVYFIGTSEGFFRSDDGARTFSKKVKGLPQEREPRSGPKQPVLDRTAGPWPQQTLSGFAAGSNDKDTILYAAVPCEVKDGKLAGGMFRSKDKGENWERCMNARIDQEIKRSEEYALGDIPQYAWLGCCDKNPQRAYVYCSGTSYNPPNHSTIYRTDDSGDSWQEVFFSDPRFNKPGMECNVETDYETETKGQREQDEMRGLEVNAGNPDMVVVVQGRSIHYTLDAGKTWKSPHRGNVRVDAEGRKQWSNTGEVVTSTWNYYIDPFDHSRHYICYTDIGFARSLDGGKSWLWEGKTIPQQWSNTTYELAFDPEVNGRIWGAFSASHDIPNYNAMYGGHKPTLPGGIGVSDDHGASWKALTLPVQLPAMSIAIDPRSPAEKRTLYASVFGAGVFRSDDGGGTWKAKNNGLDPSGKLRCLKLVLHQDGTLFVATTGDTKKSPAGCGLWRSADKGETWTCVTEGKNWDWIRDYTVKPGDSKTILLGTSRTDPGLQRTTDGGKTWEKIFEDKNEHYFFGATYHPAKQGWIYMTLGEEATKCGLYLSQDDGKSWKPFSQIPFAGIQRVTFDPDDPRHIYLSTFGSSIIKAPAAP